MKALRASQRRCAVHFLIETGKLTIAKASACLGQSERACYPSRSPLRQASAGEPVADGLNALAERYPR